MKHTATSTSRLVECTEGWERSVLFPFANALTGIPKTDGYFWKYDD